MHDNKQTGLSLALIDRDQQKDLEVQSLGDEQNTSLLRLIQQSREVTNFLALMGLLSADDSLADCELSKTSVFCWNTVLWLLLVVFLPGLLPHVAGVSPTALVWVIRFVLGLIQVGSTVFSVVCLRSHISQDRVMNVAWYKAAMTGSLATSKNTLLFLSVITIVSVIFTSICIDFSAGDCTYSFGAAVWVFVFGLSLFANNFLLVGCFFVLVTEQLVTLASIKHLIARVDEQELTHGEFFVAKRNIQKVEASQPINTLIIVALLNVLVNLFYIILNFGIIHGALFNVYFWFTSVAVYGREAIFLLVLLYHVATVNDEGTQLVRRLAEAEWTTRDKDVGRQSVLHAAIVRPIGSTIFFKKPTSFYILLQIGTTLLATAIAAAKVYLMSQ